MEGDLVGVVDGLFEGDIVGLLEGALVGLMVRTVGC